MKKALTISLGIVVALIWTTVLSVYLWGASSDHSLVSNHSLSAAMTYVDKTANEEVLTRHFQSTVEESTEPSTIIGEQVITKKWLDDVSEDGKLSIDTLLETLDLKEDWDNS